MKAQAIMSGVDDLESSAFTTSNMYSFIQYG